MRTLILSIALGCISCKAAAAQAPAEEPRIDADGTIHIPAMVVPLSRYMSEQAKQRFIERARKPPPSMTGQDSTIASWRKMADDSARLLVEAARARYPVTIEERMIGGVRAHVVIPRSGIAAANEHRVLINLHGGGFFLGAGIGALLEAIPVADVGKFKVISIDYRMAPEHHFPAASEDVAAVYAELLKQYRPENIGLYGCSAGGALSAMATAWFQKEKLPTPGAIGIIGAGAYGSFFGPAAAANTWGGDSRYIGLPLTTGRVASADGTSWRPAAGWDYLAGTDINDPLVSPALSQDVLRRFPPTLLLTGTRAYDMSAAVQTHRQLTKAGVDADLHLWDGMGHCFLSDTELPESQEAHDVIVRFFDEHLGASDE